MAITNSKWDPVSRRTITSGISKKAVGLNSKLTELLKGFTTVSATADIWSDRTMRGFFGITVHGLSEEKEQLSLKSYLLSCER